MNMVKTSGAMTGAVNGWTGIGRYWLPGLLLMMTLAGFVMLTSASGPVSEKLYGDHLQIARLRLLWIGLGIFLMAVLLNVPLAFWQRSDWVWLTGVSVLLLLTLLLDNRVNGSARWLKIGPLSLQPAELAKFVLPIYIAGYCARRAEDGQLGWAGAFYPLVVSGIVLTLIFLAPDFGTAALLFTVILATLFVAGMRLSQLSLLLVSGVLAGWVLITSSPYRMARWEAFLNPLEDPYGNGWQPLQSLVAFDRGGFFGLGLGQSVQKRFFLPEAHNDYVLAVIAEELGLVAVALIVAGFTAVALRTFWLAAQFLRVERAFSGYLMLGIGLLLAGQVSFNLASVMGLLPPKGIVLPLFSAGGSSLLVTAASMALLLRGEYELRARERF